jgi:hypothetical protein
MTSLLASRATRRRSIAFVILLAITMVLMAFSTNPVIRDVQSGVGFAFRPIQGALDSVAGGIASVGAAITEIACREIAGCTVPGYCTSMEQLR